MVKYVVFFLFLFSYIKGYPQNDSVDLMESQLINALDSWPTYYKTNFLNEFIQSNLKYPKTALKDSLEGIVYITMIVDKEGRTSDHTILKRVREDLDNEALRVSRLIKFDLPAFQGGKPVKVKYLIPVTFKLTHFRNQKLKNK